MKTIEDKLKALAICEDKLASLKTLSICIEAQAESVADPVAKQKLLDLVRMLLDVIARVEVDNVKLRKVLAG